MEYSYNRGFGSCLKEAIQAGGIVGKRGDVPNRSWLQSFSMKSQTDSDEHNERTRIEILPIVDYAVFKRKLRNYSRRRTRIQYEIQRNESDNNNSIAMGKLEIILNQFEEPSSFPAVAPTTVSTTYVAMGDGVENCNCDLPGVWNDDLDSSEHRRRRHNEQVQSLDLSRRLSALERGEITDFLASETKRMSRYYQSRFGCLDHQLLDWNKMLRKQENTKENMDKRTMLQQTVELGKNLLDLQAFCVMNTLIVRQVLIRYDAFARSFDGTPMMEFYWKMVMRSTSFQENNNFFELRQIFLHQEAISLCDMFSRRLKSYQSNTDGSENNAQEPIFAIIFEHFQKDRDELRRMILSSSVHKKQPLSTFGQSRSKTIATLLLEVIRKNFSFGMYMEDQFGWYLDSTMHRGRDLTHEMGCLAQWKRKWQKQWSFDAEFGQHAFSPILGDAKGTSSGDDDTCGMGFTLTDVACEDLAVCGREEHDYRCDPDESIVVSSQPMTVEAVSSQQKFNIFMALVGGFLYCMNYYIVEPSSTMYVNALGAEDAAGAILIGMMPIACFSSAIVYSVWTNTVYRQPFLVSCSLMVTGNIVYSAAFNYRSLSMALVGRFMTGLGGPKMIVRRYVADTTSVSIRTSVNALFGMVVAAGSALGPGCAILLSNFDFAVPVPGGSRVYFNTMTGPGWFMAFLWSIFSIALFVGFKEQDRIGLAEKLQQEALEKADALLATRLSDRERTTPTNNTNQLNESLGDASLLSATSAAAVALECNIPDATMFLETGETFRGKETLWMEFQRVSEYLLFPVRLCMGLLFAKVFVVETLVSCTSALSKRRYGWSIHEVGSLGCANGLFVIPLSIAVGKLSMFYQDRYLMICLLLVGIGGLGLLIDVSDIVDSDSTDTYNGDLWWSVGPNQYIVGYFVAYVSIQSFEGIIGSALSKLIPTALATGTFNSGLLATLVDTFGRSCGDMFIALMGFWNMRQLMNLLFVPGVLILVSCLVVVRRNYDLLAV